MATTTTTTFSQLAEDVAEETAVRERAAAPRPSPSLCKQIVAAALQCCNADRSHAAPSKPGTPRPANRAEAALERLERILPSHYFGPQALLDSIESGAIAPVRGSWLLRTWKEGGGKLKEDGDRMAATVEEIGTARVRRRQDLPREAFWSVEDVRKLLDQLGEGDFTTGNKHHANYGLLFVALSYRWLSSQHPDPDGFHLAQVASVLQLYLEPRERYAHLSPLAQMFKKKQLDGPVDCLMFWECVHWTSNQSTKCLLLANPPFTLHSGLKCTARLACNVAAFAASTRTRRAASAHRRRPCFLARGCQHPTSGTAT